MTVTASMLNVSAEELADRTAYLRRRASETRYNAAYYLAKGDFTTDDTAALQAALDDAGAAGGGRVALSGYHRVAGASGLVVPAGVSIDGVPGASGLYRDHATANLLSFADTAGTFPSEVRGVLCSDLQDNTGEFFHFDTAKLARARITGGVFGTSAHSKGVYLNVLGASKVTVDHCDVMPQLAQSFVNQGNGGVLVGHHNRITTSAAYANYIFTNAHASARTLVKDNVFDPRFTTSAAMYGLFLALGAAEYRGNDHIGPGSTVLYGINPVAGTLLSEGGNTYEPGTAPFSAGAALLGDGSVLGFQHSTRKASSSTAVTWDNGVTTLEFEGSGTEPTFTLPDQLVRGRKIRLLVKNGSGSTWGPILFTPTEAAITGSPSVLLQAGWSTVYDFEVSAVVAGTLNWTVVHRGP